MKGNHILFITTDEQHLKTISAFGATTHQTPNIDRLFACSTVFLHAYSASPVCLPSRCTWATGLYPHNSRSISNHYGASLSNRKPNLFTHLKDHGYTTSLHGKCHFIPVPYPATRPDCTLEYEHFSTYYKSLGIDVLNLQDDKNNSLWFYDDYAKNLEELGFLSTYREEAHMKKSNQGVFDFPLDAELHPDAWVGRKAVEYIQGSDASHPQFVWVSFSGPHYPVDTPASYTAQVDISKDTGRIFRENEWESSKYHYNGFHGPGTTEGSGQAPQSAQKNYSEEYWTRWRQEYFGNVVLIDEWIGNILNSAEQQWGDAFSVVFTSDHGEMMGNHSLWGKNGSLYEDVLRVPLAVRKGGQVKSHTVDYPVSSVDVFPTLLELAGIEAPSGIDGISLLDPQHPGLEYILSECENRVALIKDSVKLEWNYYQKGKTLYKELYDLHNDPHEFKNVYNQPEYEAIQSLLETKLHELEQSESLLSRIFYEIQPDKGKPYWYVSKNL